MKKRIIKESVESDARRVISNDEINEAVAQKIQNIIAFFSGLNKTDKQNIKQKIGDILWLSALQFVKDGLQDGDISSGDVEILLDNLYEKYLSKLNKEITKKEDVDKLFVSVKNGIKQNKSVEDILENSLSSLEQKALGYSLDNLSLEEIRQLGKDAIDRGDNAFKNLLKQHERRGELTALHYASDCIIYLINSKEASVACGAFTEWCTARTDEDNQFDTYAPNGLSLIWFPKEKHTYVWNGANITFGKRFGVTLLNFPRGEAQTEINKKVPNEIYDLLVKLIGEKETENLLKISKDAVIDREKQKILTAIENGADISEFLIKESEKGYTEIVKLLLDAGADVNDKDKHGNTALMLASANGHNEIIKLLLDAGADVNDKNKYGRTALFDASEYGYKETINLLLEAGADINTKDGYGRTALMWASEKCYTEIAKLLLEKDADVNAEDNDGGTALMLVSGYGYTKIVKLLLDAGADVNAEDKNGYTALKYASRFGQTEIVKLLLEAGADVNAKDRYGTTALIDASEKGNIEIVKLLLEYKADVNAKNNRLETALMWASEYGNTETVKLLLEHGADVNVKDKKGNTALILASEKGYIDIVKLMLEAGAEIDPDDTKTMKFIVDHNLDYLVK